MMPPLPIAATLATLRARRLLMSFSLILRQLQLLFVIDVYRCYAMPHDAADAAAAYFHAMPPPRRLMLPLAIFLLRCR